jgi:hypothetical protein
MGRENRVLYRPEDERGKRGKKLKGKKKERGIAEKKKSMFRV